MTPGISHSPEEETPEAKARWFQSLSPAERMDVLCEWTNFILAINPRIADQKEIRLPSSSVRIIELPKENR